MNLSPEPLSDRPEPISLYRTRSGRRVCRKSRRRRMLAPAKGIRPQRAMQTARLLEQQPNACEICRAPLCSKEDAFKMVDRERISSLSLSLMSKKNIYRSFCTHGFGAPEPNTEPLRMFENLPINDEAAHLWVLGGAETLPAS